MQKLEEQPWFSQEWAAKVHDAVRILVRAYIEACEAVEGLAKPIQLVRYGGVRGGRSVWVAKALLREAVVHHIETVLRSTKVIGIRAYAAARPTSTELRLGVKKTAPPESIAEATARRDAFVKQQEAIATLLEQAVNDIKSLDEVIGAYGKPGQMAFKTIIKYIRHLLPFAWTGFVITQFSAMSGAPQWQLFVFAVISAAAYHFFAWLTLPFYYAADRQYVLFEGYTGNASDGLAPMFPEVSRHEKALFKLLGSRPPIVISWEYLVPLLHYAVLSVLLAMMVIKLPFDPDARILAGVLGGVAILWYLKEIWWGWRLIRQRHRDRSAIEILWALSLGTHTILVLDEGGEEGAAAEKAGAADK